MDCGRAAGSPQSRGGRRSRKRSTRAERYLPEGIALDGPEDEPDGDEEHRKQQARGVVERGRNEVRARLVNVNHSQRNRRKLLDVRGRKQKECAMYIRTKRGDREETLKAAVPTGTFTRARNTEEKWNAHTGSQKTTAK